MFCYDTIKMKQMMKSLGERKLLFIESCSFYFLVFSSRENLIRQMETFTFQPKNIFYRNLHYPRLDRLIFFNFKKGLKKYSKISVFLATLMWLWCTLTWLWTAIPRGSLRRLVFVIVIDSALMPPWLVKKIKE